MTNDTDSRPIAPATAPIAPATAPIAPATAPIAPATAPIAGPPPPARVRVVVGAGVSDFVNARGGRLYVWATLHRCCTGGLTLLDAGVEPPARRRSHFTPLDADGFELSFDGGVHGLPETLVLELTRGKRKVRAYWNDCAFVS